LKVWGVKLSNAKLVKSCTTQGVVFGRRIGGSAVTGFDDPICGVVDTGTTCAHVRPTGIRVKRASARRSGRGAKERMDLRMS
jgi:hypothetical protein